MIFVGDIALPHRNAIKDENVPAELLKKNWFGNLEGAIVNIGDNSINAVYNHKAAIEGLIAKYNFQGFALANNHIMDIGSYDCTTQFLKKNNINYCGLGRNLQEANQEVVLFENKT